MKPTEEWAKQYLIKGKFGVATDGMMHFSKGGLIEFMVKVAGEAISESSLDVFRQGVAEGRLQALNELEEKMWEAHDRCVHSECCAGKTQDILTNLKTTHE